MADTPRTVDVEVRPHIHELTVEHVTPPKIVVYNRWASAVALTLAILLMLASVVVTLWLTNSFRQAVNERSTPEPVFTGCPFGDDDC